jgi:RimJ/RimL family protein N-acetyltransferase
MKPPILKTKRFSLKPYRKTDRKRFKEMVSDPDSVRFMGGPDENVETGKNLFEKVFEVYQKEDGKFLLIWGVYAGKKLVAHFELKETEHTSGDELEIVYMVHPDERKKGVMTEIMDFVKKNQILWHRPLIATVDPQNEHSLSLLEKWGIEKKESLEDPETGEKYLKLNLT